MLNDSILRWVQLALLFLFSTLAFNSYAQDEETMEFPPSAQILRGTIELIDNNKNTLHVNGKEYISDENIVIYLEDGRPVNQISLIKGLHVELYINKLSDPIPLLAGILITGPDKLVQEIMSH